MSKSISVHNMISPFSELGILTHRTCNSMNNMSSYNCRLVDAKIRASDKDLPVTYIHPMGQYSMIKLLLLPITELKFLDFLEFYGIPQNSLRFLGIIIIL